MLGQLRRNHFLQKSIGLTESSYLVIMNSTGSISQLRKNLKLHREAGKTIGLVPTMGNLHDGHIHLVRESLKQNDYTVVSIFINPMQFNPNEDLATYPRSVDQDKEKLSAAGCDFLFIPSAQEIYPEDINSHTQVMVPDLSDMLCGKTRPGHFEGVTTIVIKLLNIINPDAAYFGLKDYQQYLIVKRMTKDLEINTRIVGLETIRDAGGLALSSRNSFLSDIDINKARQLYRSLRDAADALNRSDLQFSDLEKQSCKDLRDAGLTPEYFSICNSTTLEPATIGNIDFVIVAAVYIGSVRLIDNIRVSLTDTRQKSRVIE